ncbi:MAG: hypothetical protein ABIH21_03120 [Patescibacteria group bacterium]
MREYATLRKLRAGEVVNLEGINFVMDEGEIQPGDLYIAERNTGPKLLTARKVDDQDLMCIFPTTLDYPYDLGECIKVREAEDALQEDQVTA